MSVLFAFLLLDTVNIREEPGIPSLLPCRQLRRAVDLASDEAKTHSQKLAGARELMRTTVLLTVAIVKVVF